MSAVSRHRRALRPFALALVAVVAAATAAAAFSLGAIEVTGSYQKRFAARIPAFVNGQEGLTVAVGDEDDYRRVGVKRPPFVDEITLTVVDHPTAPGQKMVLVESAGPIATPSFNLLVRAALGGGRILENYFMAVDFQRKLSMTTEPTPDESDTLDRIAEEMRRMREGGAPPPVDDTPKGVVVETDADDIIARLRAEEADAERRDRAAAEPTLIERMRSAEEEQPPPTPIPEPTSEPVESDATLIARYLADERAAMRKETAATATEPVAPVDAAAVEPTPSIQTAPVEPAAPLALLVRNGGEYRVERGDTLYGLAKKAGVGRALSPQMVAALWMNNKDAFIRGNMHGLKADARLDFSAVADTADRLSRREAEALIRTQWDAWREKTAPAATTPSLPSDGVAAAGEATPSTDGRLSFRSAALAALTDWRAGVDTGAATVGERADGNLEVTLPDADDPAKSVTALVAVAPDGTAVVRGTVDTDAAVTDDPTLPRRYVVHVASFREEEAARRMVVILRRKGYAAYDILTSVADEGEWYRVAVDRFGDREAAFAFARRLRRDIPLSYTRVLSLPYAVAVGPASDPAEARRRVADLERIGVFGAYTVKDMTGDAPREQTLVGAFAAEKEAAVVADRLADEGYSVRVTAP